MNVFAIDYDKKIKRAKNNLKEFRQQGWTENPEPDSGKRDISYITEGEGSSRHIYMTVFPDASSQLLDKYSLKTFRGKNCIMMVTSMAIFKDIFKCHLYVYSLNAFKLLHLLAQLEFCIVGKGIISFFKPPALSVFVVRTGPHLPSFMQVVIFSKAENPDLLSLPPQSSCSKCSNTIDLSQVYFKLL